MPKPSCLGYTDWSQSTRLIFILLQTFFNAPKCTVLKVLPSCSHPNMSNLNLLYHTGRDVDCFPFWMLICFARGYLKADSECILAVGDRAWGECLDFDPGRCWRILMTCCFMNESNVPLEKKRGVGRGGGGSYRVNDLSGTCCLHLVKTGRDQNPPGSPKLDPPTCCPDLSLIF